MVQIVLAIILFLEGSSLLNAQVLTFPRCNSATLTMEFVYANPDLDPYDLYSSSRQATCGKRAGTITGTGSYADPYIIKVDLSFGLTSQSPDCGIQQTGPTSFRMVVKSVFSSSGSTANDTDYTVQCDQLTLPTTSTLSTTPQPSRSAVYTCQAPSAILFTYSQNSPDPPFDIYAVGKDVTCSKSANQGSGIGLESDPYILNIDVSDISNPCGFSLTGTDTYSITMYVQQVPGVITSDDVAFALTCNFTALASQIISATIAPVVNNVPVGVANVSQPSASLFVVSSSTGVVSSTFAIGDPIRLAAQLVDGPATGVRISDCTVSPGPGQSPQLTILDERGCSTGSNLVPAFNSQSPSGSKALTNSFAAFKFRDYDTLYFRCRAEFCYSDTDAKCTGTHCRNSRRKRAADVTTQPIMSDVISAYVVVVSGPKINFTGSTGKDTTSTNDNSVQCSRNTSIIIVVSLASVCAASVLIAIGLALKIFALTSRHKRHRHEESVVTSLPRRTITNHHTEVAQNGYCKQ